MQSSEQHATHKIYDRNADSLLFAHQNAFAFCIEYRE